MKLSRLVFTAAGLFAVGVAVRAVPAANASHQWGCYKWNSPELTYSNIATSPYSTYYSEETRTASDSWHNYTVVNFTPGNGGNNVKEMSGSYGSNGWLGLTQIWTSGCTITRAEAKVNRTYLDRSPYNTAAWRKKVTCHEVGHSTGLNHNQVNTSCLLTGGPSQDHPNAHDADQLDSMY